MDKVSFSLIVPCYNVQDYLEQCINSILTQTYHNFEVILVDDGATDSTPELCDRLALSDKRIFSYHKKNGGLSDARNYGMEKANGDYYVFVDSDDFISESALEHFACTISKSHPDVLLTRLTEYYGSNDIIEQDMEMGTFFSDGVTIEKALQWEMKKSKSAWPAQKKILSSRFVKKNNLRFLKGFLHEDVDWSSRIMMHAEEFAICTETWYYHRMKREGSITNTISSKRIVDVIEMAERLIDSDEMHSITDERREIISERIMRSVYPMLAFYGKLSNEGKAQVVKCCKEHKELLQMAPEKRHKMFVKVANIFGFRIALSLLSEVGGDV